MKSCLSFTALLKNSKSSLLLFGGVAILSGFPGRGGLIVKELFDGMALNVTLDGQGDSAASLGFQPASTWSVNASAPTISTANNFNVEDSPALPGLPAQEVGLGGLWKSGGGDWNTGYWATRPLAAAINFDAEQTLYFSFRLSTAGDTAVGMGLSSGSAPTSTFVGLGGHWDNHTDVFSQPSANALYLSTGTLNQDLPGNNDGPYASLSHTAAGSLLGRALIVGRLSLTASGADQIDVRMYFGGDTIESNLSSIPWDISESQTLTGTASHLLVWLNGNGNGELDAIRIGTTWEDVTGVSAIPEPTSAALLGVSGMVLLLRRRMQAR